MKKLSLFFTKYWIFLLSFFGNLFFNVQNIFAADEGFANLQETATEGQLPTIDLFTTIGKFISALLGLLGVIFLLLTLYAGFLWMTAGGENEKVKKAKSILTQAVIGIIIITAAYAITNFVGETVLGTSESTTP